MCISQHTFSKTNLYPQIIQCMNKDSSKGRLEKVYVDGGMTQNDFLLQLLANILGIPVGRSQT